MVNNSIDCVLCFRLFHYMSTTDHMYRHTVCPDLAKLVWHQVLFMNTILVVFVVVDDFCADAR